MNLRGPSPLVRSDRSAYLALKAFCPGLLIVAAMLALGGGRRVRPAGFLLLTGIVIAAAVMGSLADVELRPEGVRYRRLFTWRLIAYEDILGVGRVWALGWLRPRSLMLPWGVLFFALARSVEWNNPLIAQIREAAPALRSKVPTPWRRRWLQILGFWSLGFAAVLVAALVIPSPLLRELSLAPQGGLFPKFALIREVIWGVTAVLMIALALLHRRPRLNSFVSGMALAWFLAAAQYVFR